MFERADAMLRRPLKNRRKDFVAAILAAQPSQGILGSQGTVTVPLLFLYRLYERVLSLLLGPRQGCNPPPTVASLQLRAVYSWKWSRYETKRGTALLTE